MKKILQTFFLIFFVGLGFSQVLKPIAQKVLDRKSNNKNFVKYTPFSVNYDIDRISKYSEAATDITVLKLDKIILQNILASKPDNMELTFPFEGKHLTVELIKNNIFTEDFKVLTSDGTNFNYTPGLYYQGIVKDDPNSIVAFSFFSDDIVGVTSIKNVGNVIIGKAIGSSDFVSYNDVKLKGQNPFVCGVEDLKENQKHKTSFKPTSKNITLTSNCVRVYYEVGYGPYTQNGSNATTTTNWATSMFNNVSTLYSNDGIKIALSQVFVWTTTDTGSYSGPNPSDYLNQFRNKRPTFNGDVAQLLRNPATTSIAWVDALCSSYKYSYCGVNKSYSNVPTYSWNIEAMTHEMGHNLGSPHTHACAWNGNDTAIDGCGPAAGYDEGCAAPLPSGGGTIMSYCHLTSTGINFANGFGVQPGELIRNTVESRGCLGTNCTNSCEITISSLDVSNVTNNSAVGTIVDATNTSWKYKVTTMNGTAVTSGNTTSKTINISGLQSGTYYKLSVGTSCSGPLAFQKESVFLTDANWCNGAITFTDPGGASSNYGNNQFFVKTFYPSSPGQKLKLTFTEFALEDGYDFIDILDGKDINAQAFSNGGALTGFSIPGPFTATNTDGAITLVFSSDAGVVDAGWVANFQCLTTLATGENSSQNTIMISPNPVKNIANISSPSKIKSYKIYGSDGKLILSNYNVSKNNFTIDLSAYKAGTYLISVTTENETITKKIIKN